MANLKGMTFDHLLALRESVERQLDICGRQLQQQLARLGGEAAKGVKRAKGHPRRGSKLAGRKVAPKYRSRKDPSLTWAGRGATPRWMREEMKAGKLKKDAFLIK